MSPRRFKAKVNMSLCSWLYRDCGLVVDGGDPVRDVGRLPSFCELDSERDLVQDPKLEEVLLYPLGCQCQQSGCGSHQEVDCRPKRKIRHQWGWRDQGPSFFRWHKLVEIERKKISIHPVGEKQLGHSKFRPIRGIRTLDPCLRQDQTPKEESRVHRLHLQANIRAKLSTG